MLLADDKGSWKHGRRRRWQPREVATRKNMKRDRGVELYVITEQQ